MKFHREGKNIILITLCILACFNLALVLMFPVVYIYHIFFWLFCAVILVLILRFFRKPGRGLNESEFEVLSSADGVVVAIEEVEEPEYMKTKCIQLSVFMSIHNVHINWYPIAGKVCYYKYHPGSYLIAHHPKSSTENERTTVVVENSKGQKILLRQIAGMVARRIVCYAKEGSEVKQGQEVGFIKFGSRVDIFLPLDAEILVSLGEKVKGRITAIARLN
jgi:phosphatidylserine decarboxylase